VDVAPALLEELELSAACDGRPRERLGANSVEHSLVARALGHVPGLVVASAAKEGRHLALQNLDEISDMLVPQSAARQGLAVAFAAKPDWLARSL